MKTWTPLKRAVFIPKTKREIQQMARDLGRPYKELKDAFAREDREAEVWMNDHYQVALRRSSGMVWLSIKTIDNTPLSDWRDKQAIKNQLVGLECECVELYPAESRIVDLANQTHIWCVSDPTFRFPFGFDYGRNVSEVESGGSRQRPLSTGEE